MCNIRYPSSSSNRSSTPFCPPSPIWSSLLYTRVPYVYLKSKHQSILTAVNRNTNHLDRHSTASRRTDRSGSSSAFPNSCSTRLFMDEMVSCRIASGKTAKQCRAADRTAPLLCTSPVEFGNAAPSSPSITAGAWECRSVSAAVDVFGVSSMDVSAVMALTRSLAPGKAKDRWRSGSIYATDQPPQG